MSINVKEFQCKYPKSRVMQFERAVLHLIITMSTKWSFYCVIIDLLVIIAIINNSLITVINYKVRSYVDAMGKI